MLAKSCSQQAKKTLDTDEVETGTGTGTGVKCGNENGVEAKCGDRLNSPAYKHKHVGYCLHVKAAASASASGSGRLRPQPRLLLLLHFILPICQLFNQQPELRCGRRGREVKAVAHSRQTISYTQKLNRFSAGSIIRRAVPGLIWKNVFPARNKQNLLSNTHTQIHTYPWQCWVYSAGIKKVICYCFLSRPRISL